MAAAILRPTSQDSSPCATSSTSPTQSSSGPSDEDIEAIIQMATSATNGRSPAPKDTRTQLFVGNLPYRVRWQDLKDLFRKAGTVLRADVSLGPDNRSRGYGTVLLATAEDAGRAVDMFNGYNWQTRTLEVRPDRTAPDFDSPIPSIHATPTAGYSSSYPLFSGNAPALSAPPLISNLEDSSQSLSSSRPGTATGNGGRNLFVGNLPFHCQWQDLKDLFRQAGTIVRADVALGPDGRSRGFGTVVFATDFDAERGVKMFNGYEFNGRPLKVHYDKFSPSQSGTVPTSPMPQAGFQIAPPFNGFSNQDHMPIPFRYTDFGPSSGPSSPFDIYPPYLVMQHVNLQPHSTQSDQSRSPLLDEPQPPPLDTTTQFSDTANNTASNLPPSKDITSDSTTPPNTHHHHPGRIALPPPSVTGFPPPHTLSPHAISPLHHPMSPMHHPHVIAMTPHGLPPITPSMPSFTFLPQPSPSTHGPSHLQNPPTPGYEGVSGAVPIMTPYAPFSPGLTMSPGAFWGRPGPGVNPYAAVGAPVHLQHTAYGMHAAGSPVGFREDPGGYFPPVPPQDYFPFVPPTSGLSNEIMPDRYTGDVGSFKPKEERTMPDSGSVGTTNGDSTELARSWNTADEDDEDDKDIEIFTGSMETLGLGGQQLHPRVFPTGSTGKHNPVERNEDRQQRNQSSTGLGPNGLHRAESDPVQSTVEKLSQPSTSARPLQHRRTSFTEAVFEGTSPVQRNSVAIGLGIRVPGS